VDEDYNNHKNFVETRKHLMLQLFNSILLLLLFRTCAVPIVDTQMRSVSCIILPIILYIPINHYNNNRYDSAELYII